MQFLLSLLEKTCFCLGKLKITVIGCFDSLLFGGKVFYYKGFRFFQILKFFLFRFSGILNTGYECAQIFCWDYFNTRLFYLLFVYLSIQNSIAVNVFCKLLYSYQESVNKCQPISGLSSQRLSCQSCIGYSFSTELFYCYL